MPAERSAEHLLPELQPVNVNDSCRVALTEDGLAQYRAHYARYGLSAPQLDVTENRASFQIWEIMHIFGPKLGMGSNELPFRGNTLTIKAEGTKSNKQPSKAININDDIYVFVTFEGRDMLSQHYRGQAPRPRMVGTLSQMQFYDVAHIFGSEMYMGARRQPIDNTFYLPPRPKGK